MSEQHEAADFFRWLDAGHRDRICQIVSEKYPGLSRQDVEDVWSETRKDLLKKWPSENGFDMHRPLEGLLRTIALRRACDMLRRLTAQDNLVKRVGEQAGSNLGSDGSPCGWWGSLDPAERQELQDFTAEAFRLLSADEWLVLSVYCEQYPGVAAIAAATGVFERPVSRGERKGLDAGGCPNGAQPGSDDCPGILARKRLRS